MGTGAGGAGHGFGSASSQTSVESPDLTYRYTMQHQQSNLTHQQQVIPHADSPPQHHQHPFSAHAEQFAPSHLQPLFGGAGPNPPSEYGTYPENDAQAAFDAGVYRNNSMFGNFFPTRTRQSTAPSSSSMFMNDNGAGSFQQYGTTAADVFGAHQPAPPHSMQGQGNDVRGYDFVNGPQNLGGPKGTNKPIFNMDPFGAGIGSIMQSHQINKQNQQQHQQFVPQNSYLNGMMQTHTQSHSQTPFGPHLNVNGSSSGMSHTNGGGSGTLSMPTTQQEEISTIFVVGFPEDMQEREFQNMFTFSSGFEAATLKIPNKDSTAYGANAPSSNNVNSGRGTGAFQLGYPYGGMGANDPYNLVTVNQGGVIVDGRDGTTTSWPAPDGADLLGGGMNANPNNQGGQGPVPPRKQIIGFAKFRSRAEALVARDLLQGRRVDFEKGSVLKAEMAKKNLHTKRGVGPLGSLSNTGGNVGGGTGLNVGGGINGSMTGLINNANTSVSGGLMSMSDTMGVGVLNPAHGSETLAARERELGTIGAMGLGSMAARRERERLDAVAAHEDDHDLRERENRRRRDLGSVSVGPAAGMGGLTGLGGLGGVIGPRGARERIEEDERERERKRKEREAGRLRTGSSAFEVFQSGGVSMGALPPLRNAGTGSNLLSPTDGLGANANSGYGLSAPMSASAQQFSPQETLGGVSLEGWPANAGSKAGAGQRSKLASLSVNGVRSLPIGVPMASNNNGQDPTRPPSSQQSSPSDAANDTAFLHSASPREGGSSQQESSNAAPEPSSLSSLNSNSSKSSLSSRSRPYSPTQEALALSSAQPFGHVHLAQVQPIQPQTVSSVGTSSSSSFSGSRSSSSSIDGDVSLALGNMDITSQQGTISPQLPSPNSGASSGTRGNASDQNPPINTLYVGNLPTSPMPAGYPPNYLEDSLRTLFARCPGYRKLCFRQKSNGPMCFVEFEDVHYATRALNDLYGNQLNGLIKGGIRLSYSKNPLGVRTPTNTNSGSNFTQQQGHMQTFGTSSSYSSMQDAFSNRNTNGILQVNMDTIRASRRDEVTSPSSYHYAASPPRFFSPPPSGFGLVPQSAPALPRANSQSTYTSSFSPFGSSTPPSMTPQLGPAEAPDALQPPRAALSSTPSIEAARAS